MLGAFYGVMEFLSSLCRLHFSPSSSGLSSLYSQPAYSQSVKNDQEEHSMVVLSGEQGECDMG